MGYWVTITTHAVCTSQATATIITVTISQPSSNFTCGTAVRYDQPRFVSQANLLLSKIQCHCCENFTAVKQRHR